METFVINTVGQGLLTVTTDAVAANPSTTDGVNTEDGTMVGAPTGAGGKDPLLSSWPFVLGISAAVLAISIIIGVLLAKRKIKKGIELYED
jgi:hypothetical protein